MVWIYEKKGRRTGRKKEVGRGHLMEVLGQVLRDGEKPDLDGRLRWKIVVVRKEEGALR